MNQYNKDRFQLVKKKLLQVTHGILWLCIYSIFPLGNTYFRIEINNIKTKAQSQTKNLVMLYICVWLEKWQT